MGIIVNTKNEQEEKVLIAFLERLNYKYHSGLGDTEDDIANAFLDDYNEELVQADADVESGNYITHDEVKELFEKRRKTI